MALTDERIEDLWYMYNNSSPTDGLISLREFVRAIEVEVRAEAQEPITAQSDNLYPLLASAWFYGDWIAETGNERQMQVIMERAGWWPIENEDALLSKIRTAPQPVAWFAFADSNGPMPLELWGFDLKSCKQAVLENARSVGWKGTIEGYLFQKGWSIRPLGFIAPQQPPAPCPKCAEKKSEQRFKNADLLNRLDKMQRSHYYATARPTLRQAELVIAQQETELADIDALQAKVAELEASVENWIRGYKDNYRRLSRTEVERNQLKTKVVEQSAEIERQNRAYEAQDEARSRDFETIAQQAALIEKCGKLLRRYFNETPIGHQPHMIAEPAHDLLAAIATQKS